MKISRMNYLTEHAWKEKRNKYTAKKLLVKIFDRVHVYMKARHPNRLNCTATDLATVGRG